MSSQLLSQLLGDSAPTKLLETGDIIHLALWSPLLYQTRCGVSFSIKPAWVDGAERVEESVSCITCLVRTDVFEVPLVGIGPKADGERAYYKQVFGPPHNYVTECCYEKCPCDCHETKELP